MGAPILFLHFHECPPERSRRGGGGEYVRTAPQLEVTDGLHRRTPQPSLSRLRRWQPRIPDLRFLSESERCVWTGEATHVWSSFPSSLLEALLRWLPAVEPLGPRSAYADLRGLDRLHPDRRELLRRLAEEGCDAGFESMAAGEGHSRLVARLAAAVAPPGAYWSVPRAAGRGFLAPFPLPCAASRRPPLLRALADLGVLHCGDLAALPAALLEKAFGVEGLRLWRRSRGEADDDGGFGCMQDGAGSAGDLLQERYDFARPVSDPSLVASTLAILADRLAMGLRQRGLLATSVQLWARHHGGRRWSRRRRLHPATDSLGPLRSTALRLWEGRAPSRTAVCSCGLTLPRTHPRRAEPLKLPFESPGREQADLERSIQRIRERFGPGSIVWSTEIWMRN